MPTSISWPTRNATIEPPMVHSPWPNTLANATCMSGTPRSAFTVTHHGRGREPDRDVGEQERVADQPDRDERNEAHAAPAEVFVDHVRHHEHDRPQQHAGREAQRARLAEQGPAERRQPERGLESEDLHADELGDDGVGREERREHDEEPRRSRGEQCAHWRLSTRIRSRRSRLSGRPLLTGADRRLSSRAWARAASLSGVSR